MVRFVSSFPDPSGVGVPRGRSFRGLDGGWEADTVALLDDQHVAVSDPDPENRLWFGATLTSYLGLIPETQVVTIVGGGVADLDGLCQQLEAQIHAHRLARRIDGPGGLVSLLRAPVEHRWARTPKRRFFIWQDADVLLNADSELFSRVVEAFLGVSAESEFGIEDTLFLQRLLLIGDSSLGAYADNPSGQFCAWRQDNTVGDPFWAAISGLSEPRVAAMSMEDALSAAVRASVSSVSA